jgi:hypothetical protein
MTNHPVFGYAWEDIQRAQAGGQLQKPLVRAPLQTATPEDKALLQRHGSIEALQTLGLHGVVDRLSRESKA